jgi:alpha-galactosidase
MKTTRPMMERRMALEMNSNMWQSGLGHVIGYGPLGTSKHLAMLLYIALICSVASLSALGQANVASIAFNSQTRVFRIDAAEMSYVLGINEKKQVQTLYWGKRLSAADTFDVGISEAFVGIRTPRSFFATSESWKEAGPA